MALGWLRVENPAGWGDWLARSAVWTDLAAGNVPAGLSDGDPFASPPTMNSLSSWGSDVNILPDLPSGSTSWAAANPNTETLKIRIPVEG